MIEKTFKIVKEDGLHARLSTELVKIANKYNSKIKIASKNIITDFKSIMSVLALGLTCQETFVLHIEGADEEEAMKELSLRILESGLGKEV